MSDETVVHPPLARERRGLAAGSRLFAIRVTNYLTNHLVSHIPSYGFRRFWYRHVVGIELGPGAGIHLNCYIWDYGRRQVRADRVRIGARSRINRSCTLDVREGLHIGDDVSVSAECFILTAADRVGGGRSVSERRPVVIEDHAWIGVRAIIMPGVRIGRGAVVAAGSVVTADVPARAVVFGVPARSVGHRDESEADHILDQPFPLFE